jgi:uncharacterized phage protein (TIGR01671 family)
MRTPKYRIYVRNWGNSENDELEYPKEGELHVYFGNWERGGYKEAIFQQFTGLLDKNGKEIYEGDIVKRLNTEYIYEVVYNEENAAYFLQNKDGEGPLSYYRKVVEVIGNIFENPELIK